MFAEMNMFNQGFLGHCTQIIYVINRLKKKRSSYQKDMQTFTQFRKKSYK